MSRQTWATTVAGMILSVASVSVHAQGSAAEGIHARYREMLQDGNPAELTVARGEELWKTKRGPKNVSLEQCDLGLGAGVVKGAYAQMPRYFADADQVWTSNRGPSGAWSTCRAWIGRQSPRAPTPVLARSRRISRR